MFLLLAFALLSTLSKSAAAPCEPKTPVAQFGCNADDYTIMQSYRTNGDLCACQSFCEMTAGCKAFSHGDANEEQYRCMLFSSIGSTYYDKFGERLVAHDVSIMNDYKCYHMEEAVIAECGGTNGLSMYQERVSGKSYCTADASAGHIICENDTCCRGHKAGTCALYSAPVAVCEDVEPPMWWANNSCAKQKSSGKCAIRVQMSSPYCMKTCGLCGEEPPATMKPSTACHDIQPPVWWATNSCAKQKSTGKCSKRTSENSMYCRKTCGNCD